MNIPPSDSTPEFDQTFVDDERPWPGLASFREQDELYFKGRGPDIEKLRTLVERERLTVLFGVSGLGKSSLLQAGLFPYLRLENFFPIYIRLDFTHAAVNLSEQVFSAIARQAQDKAIEVPANISNETLWEYFHRKDVKFWNNRNRLIIPLLCFDQFEEIFTLGSESPQRNHDVKQFIYELADLVEGRCPESVKARLDINPDEAKQFSYSRHPYKILLSLREDYLADLEGLRKWMPSIIHNRMRLSSMNGEQALTVADQTKNRLMETDVAEAIVRLVAGKHDETIKPLAELHIEPALLSLVCRELNERRIANKASKIDAQSVASNREQILENFYERSLESQSPELRRFIEDKLITINGFRNSEAYDNALGIAGITSEVLSRLIQHRLLRLEERDGVKRIELIHDVLCGVVRKSRDQRWLLEKQWQAEAERKQAQERERAAQGALRASKRKIRFFLVIALILFCLLVRSWLERERTELGKLIANAEYSLSSDPQHGLLIALLATSKTSLELPSIHRGESVNRRFSEVKKILGFDPNTDRNFAQFAYTGKALALETTNVLHQAVQASRIKYVLGPEARGLWSVAFSPDGKYMAVSGDQKIIKIWELEHLHSRKEFRSFSHEKEVRNVVFSSDGKRLATASFDGTAKIWDIESSDVYKSFEGQSGKVRTVAFSPNGLMLATGHQDGIVILWDAISGDEIKRFKCHKEAVWSVAFSPSGIFLATAGADKKTIIWDVEQGILLHTLHGHTDTVSGIAFSPDGKLLATSSTDRTARIWRVDKDQTSFILANHHSKIWNIAFSPDGTKIATTGSDGTASVWELDLDKDYLAPLFSLPGHIGRGVGIAFSPDGETLATASEDGTIRLWDLTVSPEVMTLKKHDSSVWNVLYTNRRNQLITVSDDKTIKFWDASSGKLENLLNHTSPVQNISIDVEGNRLVTLNSDGELIVWDISADTLKPIQYIQIDKDRIGVVAMSSGGGMLATAFDDNTVKLWDTESGQLLNVFEGHTDFITDLVFNPDGAQLATASDDGTIRVWDINSVNKYKKFSHEHVTPIRKIAFDPSGNLLISASVGGQGSVWDVEKGYELYILSGHIGEIHDVAFSRNGERIASAGEDGTIRIWSAISGKLELKLTGYPGIPLSVNFSLDDDHIAVAGTNKTVEIFALNTRELVDLAKKRLRHTNDPALKKCKEYLIEDFCNSIE